MSTHRLVIASACAAMLFVSAVAHAQRAPAMDAVLQAIDTTPTRQQLESAWPDALRQLADAAVDPSRTRYERDRAITLMSLFDAAEAVPMLEHLATSDDVRVRTTATYTLVRAFQQSVGASWVPRLEQIAQSTEGREAQYAVRALRWVDDPSADDALARLANTGGATGELAMTIRERRRERRATRAPVDISPGELAP